ncbi:MAG: TolB-like protein/Tfp pilus assembly protein PilF [Bacteroidia bacterium]
MSLFEELKRRNVIKVGIAYAVVAWLVLQFSDVILNNIEAPGWVFQVIMLVLGIGFLLALFFAWAFEMTPEGIKKEKDVDRSQSITPKTGRKLDFTIIGLLVLVAGYFIWESRFAGQPELGSDPFSNTENLQTDDEANQKRALTPVLTEAKDNSIAVLPFANRSRLEDDEFFTDGIHDDLLTQLAKIKDLKVISRTSMMQYKDTSLSIPQIAKELGVSTILEGGIQRAGGRVRINAQLIDVTTDEHLWAETFDREMTIENIFEIQSEITRQIVTAVRGELTEADQNALSDAPTQNIQAYEAYLRGRAAIGRADYVASNYIEAEPWIRRAIELDPDFAEAWAQLVVINGQAKWMGFDDTPQRRTEAENALARAKSLKPAAPEVLLAEADFYYRFDEDYEKSLTLFLRARDAAPGHANIHVFTAITQRRTGYWNEAIASFERALELDPSNNFVINQLIDTLSQMNQWERVKYLTDTYVLRFPESRDLRSSQIQSRIFRNGDLKTARELMDLLPPFNGNGYAFPALFLTFYERDFDASLELLDHPMVSDFFGGFGSDGLLLNFKGDSHYFKGEVETAKSYYQQALEALENHEPIGPTNNAFRMQSIAHALLMIGDTEAALRASEQSVEFLSAEDDHLFGAGVERGHIRVLAITGQRQKALERIEAQLDQPEGFNRGELHFSPYWDFFRDDPRFVALATPPDLNEVPQ